MSAQTPSKYTFLPWVKMGLGASISNNDLQGPRAKIKVDLSVRRFDRSNNPIDQPQPDISKNFVLYGPGDIIGILNSMIIRIQPIANDMNFESNYFPFIEFLQPDFPWRYTPAMPSGTQPSRLSPWISLVVLKEHEYKRDSSSSSTTTERGLLPQIFIKDPKSSLPDLEQCWACAHTQIIGETSQESLRDILASGSHRGISRLLSLRKLEPNSRYSAFLVPSFEVGRLAGLGLPIDGAIKGTTFAWTVRDSSPGIPLRPMQNVLPVYYQWDFSTSAQTGDFESLVEKLEQRPLSKDVGLQKLDVSEPFLSVDKDIEIKKPLFFGGVLWSPLAAKEFMKRKKIDVREYFIGPNPKNTSGEVPDTENPSNQEIKEFIMAMKEIIDLGERLSWSFVKRPPGSNELKDPIISPPMYGKWHARKRLISKISDDNMDPLWLQSLNLDPHPDWEKIKNDHPYEWLEEVNLDPTNRTAAGLGAAVIQELQEELMASAWDQAGPLREANKHLRISQLARTISSNLFERSFQTLEGDVLVTMARSLHSKVIVEKHNKSVAQLLRSSPIPKAIFTTSFTKITAKRSKVHRRLFDRNVQLSFDFKKLNADGNPDVHAATIASSDIHEGSLLTIDHLLEGSISERNFQGEELENLLSNQPDLKKLVEDIEKSIPSPKATVVEVRGEDAHLPDIYSKLKDSLNPVHTIELKVAKEVTRPERLQEGMKDKLDPIVAYPEFKRPMFEPLRDLSEDLLLPGINDIPVNTIALLVTNPSFINSYMVGLNHEMARELLWREYPTDQRGSYFRQFWDTSMTIERERIEFPLEKDDKIIEKYRDIPEIHKWKDSPLKEIHKWKDSPQEGTPTITQGERPVLLIKAELLMRYPGAVIYASKAELKNGKLDLPEGEKEDIKLPILRGTIAPDITLLGFDISLDELCGDVEKGDPGYFFVIQEQPSEPRFAVDNDDDSTGDHTLPQSWNKLKWHHVEPSLGSNNYIDLETGPLKGLKLENDVEWGSHAAHLAYILLQQPVRIAVHARELMEKLKSKDEDKEEDEDKP